MNFVKPDQFSDIKDKNGFRQPEVLDDIKAKSQISKETEAKILALIDDGKTVDDLADDDRRGGGMTSEEVLNYFYGKVIYTHGKKGWKEHILEEVQGQLDMERNSGVLE